MTAITSTPRPVAPGARPTGRPWPLFWLWLALTAPLCLAGTALQPVSGVDPRALPLVMVGPGIAWLVCRLAVPGWFPPDAGARGTAAGLRSAVATVATCATFVGVLWAVTAQGAVVRPDGPAWAAIMSVAAGLVFGSWCEEIGYRGVMYRVMASRWGAVPTVVVNGMFFGLTHLQYLGDGPLPVALFLTMTMLLDLAMAAVWTGSWRVRVAVATVIHAAMNISLQLRGLEFTSTRDFAVGLGAMAVATVVAVVTGQVAGIGDLGGERSPRRR